MIDFIVGVIFGLMMAFVGHVVSSCKRDHAIRVEENRLKKHKLNTI